MESVTGGVCYWWWWLVPALCFNGGTCYWWKLVVSVTGGVGYWQCFTGGDGYGLGGLLIERG